MNTKRDAERVVDRFGIEVIKQVQAAIRESRERHPPDVTCTCEAMEALGVLIRLPQREGRGSVEA